MAQVGHAGQAFGLRVSSNHPLPELTPLDTAAPSTQGGVEIDWREPVPAALPDEAQREQSLASGDSFHLKIPGVAVYDITSSRITVTPQAQVDDRSIRVFLFGSAFGALLHVRGLTVLHGSAVALPDGSAAVFCGQSTAGKSTLAAALAGRGHLALADDITAVRFDADGQAWCLPGLARTKLWRDALDTLGLADRASAATRVMPDMDKHLLPLATGSQPLPLRRIYEIQARDEGGPLAFSAVTGMDKVTLLLTHVYRPSYAQAMGRYPALLRDAASLARQLTVNRIVRPRHEPTLDAIVGWLESQWAT